MGRRHGRPHGVGQRRRHRHLELDFWLAVQFPQLPHVRVGAFQGPERADARRRETAFVVVPKVPCAGFGHRTPHHISLGFRHKHRPLFKALSLRTENLQGI